MILLNQNNILYPSVLVRMDFLFSIYNPIHNDSLSIIEKEIDTSLSLTANLKAVFHESDFLNHPYKQVNIMMASKRFTIAPLDLFEEEQAELLFYHNHQKRGKRNGAP